MKEWLTLDELSTHLKMSRAALYKMAQKGELPAVKLGHGWRFDRETIDGWLEKQKNLSDSPEFPWQDCLDQLLQSLQEEFVKRFASLWVYGSWARGEARPDSDIDLLVVLDSIQEGDLKKIRSFAYEATFGRNRSFVFSTQVVDRQTFLFGMEPLLLNVRGEGRRTA